VTFDAVQVLPAKMPRWLGAPARLALQSLIGHVRVPSPITAVMNRNPKHSDRVPYAWNTDYPARVGVMPREGGNRDVRWFDIEPCYVYHPLNAYTEMRDGAEVLVLDVVRHGRMFDRDRRGPGESLPTLDRWTINLSTGAVSTECRDDRSQEFPRINETLLGGRHRFGYTVGIEGGFAGAGRYEMSEMSEMVMPVYKHDYTTGSTLIAELDPALLMGEVCFVPNPGAGAEDDGILMGYGYHRGRAEGQLLLLDAQTLESVATVHLPQRVPMGFHGNWAPAG
jgi:carotenoid cleavage oxygenase